MTKEEFIDLVQVPPIGLDSKRAYDVAEGTIQNGMDLGELYNALYNVCKCIKIIEAQANWFDNFRKRL